MIKENSNSRITVYFLKGIYLWKKKKKIFIIVIDNFFIHTHAQTFLSRKHLGIKWMLLKM